MKSTPKSNELFRGQRGWALESATKRTIVKLGSAALFLGFVVLAVNCDSVMSRQSWSRKWGPMVPHETFPGDCGVCHIPESWNVLRADFKFDHEDETGFVLEGAHAYAQCLRCHNDRGPVKTYVDRGCGGCHVDPHKSALGLECTDCHNQMTWYPGGLVEDHARTRFPLVAAHAITPCESCHERSTTGDYSGAPVECHICHRFDADRAVPNHVVGVGWTNNCQRCHTVDSWNNRGFVHDFFPLQGGHAGLDCTQCHVNGLLLPIPPACFACHQNDYTAAPNHVANNFSTDCTLCHNIFAW